MFHEIDLDDVFVEAGHGFGPPGFETEPPPLNRLVLGSDEELPAPKGLALCALAHPPVLG